MKENINLSPEVVGMLNSLIEKDGFSIQVLSKIADRDTSATTRLIDNLEKKYYVERKSAASDRWIWEIFITTKGKDEVSKANLAGRDYVSQISIALSSINLFTFLLGHILLIFAL